MKNTAYQRWICDACGYIYDEAKGDEDSGLSAGTVYADIPDDWQCPLCGLCKSDLRLLAKTPDTINAAKLIAKKSPAKNCRGGDDYIVIVGAGVAGWSVAEAIRETDLNTPILLVSACAGISYPKPALSSAFALGKTADDLADKPATEKADSLQISVRTDTRIIKMDVAKKRLTTSKGGIQYNKLILALGAQQRELGIHGSAANTVMRVNDLASYKKMRNKIEQGVKHITVLGAGLIGCEFADDLSTAGYKVSIVDPCSYPLASLLPEETARNLQQALQNKGVQWYLNTTLKHLEQSPENLTATLSSEEYFETDLVLSAAGLVANTKLAEKAGLSVSNGIDTDAFMRTSKPHIYALGDCASVNGKVFAFIEPIRRQAHTIAADLQGNELRFDSRPPLVRVKTPSFPLSICPPENDIKHKITSHSLGKEQINYVINEDIVGFVISGNKSNEAAKIYQELFN